MKAVIQRVMKASVSVGGVNVSSIDRGLCVLIGISNTDTVKDVDYIVRKILTLSLFDHTSGKRWCADVMEKGYEVLCVSQFTLCHTIKGTKLDFHNAMPADKSKEVYKYLMDMLKKLYKSDKIKDGVFGEYMQVSIENDGPVTIQLESPFGNKRNKNDTAANTEPQKAILDQNIVPK